MEQNDTFTLQDRKELIRQGIQLDKVEQDIEDVKLLVNATFKDSGYERRIRQLEDAALIMQTQRKDYEDNLSKTLQTQRESLQNKLNSYLVIATLIAGAVGTVIQFVVERLFIK